eukprot:jgi/Astpho2/1634/Aster-08270
MTKSKPGSGKRQDRNFELVVNHITINEDQLPQVSRQSMAALQDIFGHNIKKYSGTLHHKPGNEHVHFLVMSAAPKSKSAVKARIAAFMSLIFGTEAGSVDVKLFNELKADAGPAHSLKGLGDYRSLYVNNNDHENYRPKDPEHRTVECMCSGDWEISHGGARNGSGRQGPVQVAIAAIRAGTPELQCKTYEEFERLLKAAAESVGCTTCALPRVLAKTSFGTVSKRKEGNLIRNPAYDEEEFKALPKKQQTIQRMRSMKYLQGPNGSLQEEPLVVAHQFLEAYPPDFYRFRLLEPVRKLQSGCGYLSVAKSKQLYEEAFINLFKDYPPPEWTSGRAPARACVSHNLPAAVIADPFSSPQEVLLCHQGFKCSQCQAQLATICVERGDQPFQKFETSVMKHHAEMSAEQGAMLGCSHTRVQTEFGSSAASLQRGKVSQVAAPLTSGSSGREP